MAKKTAQGPPFLVEIRERPPAPGRRPIYPYSFNHSEPASFFPPCSAVKIRHGTEMAVKTGPEFTNDEGSVGKPFSLPLSEHQEWRERPSEPSASYPSGLQLASAVPPGGGHHLRVSFLASIPHLLHCQTFLFMSGLFKESIFF